jgi:hypothetical protein
MITLTPWLARTIMAPNKRVIQIMKGLLVAVAARASADDPARSSVLPHRAFSAIERAGHQKRQSALSGPSML